MFSEGAPEYYFDQGMYYPASTDYGYVYTGLEAPSDSDGHHRVFGLDGQEIQYSGVQTENVPYVYYTPAATYGYNSTATQSPYNPYNPLIPGAILSADGSYIGSQHYYYENNPASVPAYYPMVVQPGTEIVPAGSFNTNRATASKPILNNQPYNSLVCSNRNVGSSTKSATQVYQGRSAHVVESTTVHNNKNSSNLSQVKEIVAPSNNLSKSRPNSVVEKCRPKFQNPDTLNEKYRGHKPNITNNYLTVKAYTTRAGETDAQGNIVIYRDRYNKDSFSVDYKNAKFFVIKSYSEDDVHKGVKYNVWSSTPTGNKKLNMVYEDAQRISSGEPGGCPIFLFFSVNASGQFCGLAEMIGPVDFYKDMDFWQQDKWSGCFPVKWHFVKDVPNINLRHIILEYNENKPVTNSRDTQEIRYKQGIEMLKIFKNHASKTSLLDDFTYYENRQKIMMEDKAARLQLISNYGNSFVIPAAALDPPRKQNVLVDLSSSKEKNATTNTKPNEIKFSEKSVDPISLNPNKAKEDMVSSLNFGSLSLDPKQPDPRPLLGSSKLEEENNKSFEVVTVGSMPVKVNGYSKFSGILTVGTIPIDPGVLQTKGDKGMNSGSH